MCAPLRECKKVSPVQTETKHTVRKKLFEQIQNLVHVLYVSRNLFTFNHAQQQFLPLVSIASKINILYLQLEIFFNIQKYTSN